MIRSNSLRTKSLLSSNPVATLAGSIDAEHGGLLTVCHAERVFDTQQRESSAEY
jgi:hypothetical protein